MKSITLTLLVLFGCINAHGQIINSGSTGVHGAFNPPSQAPAGTTLQGGIAPATCTAAFPCVVTVPLREPDPGQPIHANGSHVFNFTTVTIGPNITVKFARNKANTPVFILAQGDVTISGAIDVSGTGGPGSCPEAPAGGPGGFSGGLGLIQASPTSFAGAGSGPGGGGGNPGSSGAFANGAMAYGLPELLPLIGGSGGAGAGGTVRNGSCGGGGGGAIMIASSGTLSFVGLIGPAIVANGGGGQNYITGGVPSYAYPGSGGAIRLVATVIRGTRPLSAIGGIAGVTSAPFLGGPGRIRLDSARPLQYTGTTNPVFTKNDNPVFGQPITIFPPLAPTIRIVSIGGVDLPAEPTANINTPDIGLSAGFPNPVTIAVEGTNVPSGTPFEILASPQLGSGDRVVISTGVLVGLVGQVKKATVSVPLPSNGLGIISAVIRTPIVPEPSGPTNPLSRSAN